MPRPAPVTRTVRSVELHRITDLSELGEELLGEEPVRVAAAERGTGQERHVALGRVGLVDPHALDVEREEAARGIEPRNAAAAGARLD